MHISNERRAPQLTSHKRIKHLVIFGIVAVIIGIYTFLNGFLLNRSEIPNIAHGQYTTSKYKRVVILLVDALYSGFFPSSQLLSDQTIKLPHLSRMLRKSRSEDVSKVFFSHFIADPPTTTLQRLKALLTGSMPTFIDAGSNFGGSELQEDNLIRQWSNQGLNICQVGDQIWLELIPNGFNHSEPYPAFNIKDLDTVDNAVKKYFIKELSTARDSQTVGCDVLIGHMLGIDHCGHTFGRSHPEMDRKLFELDNFLKYIVGQLTDSDLLVVFGDHGMTLSGDHGGDSNSELDAALFIFSSTGFPMLRTFYPPDITSWPSIAQVDIVPTLATLTGIPVPYSNLGVVEPAVIQTMDNMRLAVIANYEQMLTYALQYQKLYSSISIPTDLSVKLLTSKERCQNISICLSDMHNLRSIFRTHWTQMDVYQMLFGLSVFLNGLLVIISVDCDAKSVLHRTSFVSIIVSISLGTLCSLVNLQFSTVISFMLLLTNLYSTCLTNLKSIKLSIVDFFSKFLIVFLIFVFSSNSFVVQEARILTFFLQSLILFTLFVYVSNRFYLIPVLLPILLTLCTFRFCMLFEVCREESVANSLCLSPDVVWVKPIASLGFQSWLEFITVSGTRLFVAIVCLIGSIKWCHRRIICAGTSINSLVSKLIVCLLLLVVLTWLLDANISASASHLYEDKNNSSGSAINVPTLTVLRVSVARLVFLLSGVLFCLLVYSLFSMTTHLNNCDAPIDLLQNAQHSSSFQMYQSDQRFINFTDVNDAYSSWLLTLFVICPIFPVLVLLGDSSVVPLLCLAICQFLPIGILVVVNNHKPAFFSPFSTEDEVVTCLLQGSCSWLCATYTCLVSHLGFFVTGHQTTISSIPWNAAYAVFYGDHGTYFIPGLLVLFHTYAGQLLVTMWLPLALIIGVKQAWNLLYLHCKKLYNLPVFTERILLHNHSNRVQFSTSLDRLLLRYIICHMLYTFGHLLCTLVLRRHLMVWKIFAPRLLFSLCGLFMLTLTTVFVRIMTLWGVHSCSIHSCQHFKTRT